MLECVSLPAGSAAVTMVNHVANIGTFLSIIALLRYDGNAF
jgi:hypothetical protein